MQLTQYTDYSLRILMYLASKPGGFATISEMADYYGVSRNHLVKVVHNLATSGFIQTTRGKHGGMRLARSPEHISVGEVVRKTEPNFEVAECFGGDNCCVITAACGLRPVLNEALASFWQTLDRYSLADVTADKSVQPILLNLHRLQPAAEVPGGEPHQ